MTGVPVLLGSLPPVDQDPDDVRRQACRLLDVSCSPSTSVSRPPTSNPSLSLGAWVGWLLVVVLVAAVLVLVVWLVRSYRPGRRVRRTGTDTEVVIEGHRVIDASRSPADWRREADEHASASRYRSAIRCRYRALVGDLARRDVLDEIPGRTTGEERTQLEGSRPAATEPFAAATRLFDAAWYGRTPVGADDLERFVTWERQVLDLVSPSTATRSVVGAPS